MLDGCYDLSNTEHPPIRYEYIYTYKGMIAMKLPLLALASISLSACASTTPTPPQQVPPQQAAPTAPTHTPAPPPQASTVQSVFIDPRVNNALQQQTFVPVIIELKPLASSSNQPNPNAQAAQIQQTQERVLTQLSPKEFTLGRRYNTIFAMSGSLSASGLAVLKNHPNVAKITLDGMNTIQK